MSRSFRRTPVCGITKAESDRDFKRRGHRAVRAAERAALAHARDIPGWREIFNGWGDKDGKSRFDPERFPELMRK